MPPRVRVFIACSLDGFIAGPDDDPSWLPGPVGEDDYGYGAFIAEVGAAGTTQRHALERVDVRALAGGLVQLVYRAQR
jgi:hypothetical protein